MRRRDFIKAVAGGAVGWPLAAVGQQPSPTLGFLSAVSPGPFALRMAAFHRGLNETGYVEGRNLLIESRWAEERYERLPALAAELIDRRVTVLVAYTDAAALATKAATRTIPIVFINGGDPVRAGIVPSLSRPEGNVTGTSFFGVDVAPKQLSLLHELLPGAKVIGLLVDQNLPDAIAQVPAVQEAARKLGLQLIVFPARTAADIDSAFAAFVQDRAAGLVVSSGALLTSRRKQIIALAALHALPAIYPFREFAADGGLISYGNSVPETFRQGGIYAGRILKGEKPADLPVVLSTKYEWVLNLKTAKELGLTVSPLLLTGADEVIE
ncbi:MAG TPA: ABC transporter substrate-binding protein [Bradyrhizobium sp.]|jgi:putative ABC transport system substrate-binding protein|nr:ABC transporter substrate-binding protein [Bradyrhizobium sp.]